MRIFYIRFLYPTPPTGMADGASRPVMELVLANLLQELSYFAPPSSQRLFWEHCSDSLVNSPSAAVVGHNEDSSGGDRNHTFVVNATLTLNGKSNGYSNGSPKAKTRSFVAYTYAAQVLRLLCTALNMYCAHYVLRSLCTALNMYCAHYVLHSLCAALTMYCTHCVLHSLCTALTVYQWYCAHCHCVSMVLCSLQHAAQLPSSAFGWNDQGVAFTLNALGPSKSEVPPPSKVLTVLLLCTHYVILMLVLVPPPSKVLVILVLK
jgi:hypothetical protein